MQNENLKFKIIDYLLTAIIILLPTYLIRFKILNIPTTLLEILIYAAFLFWLSSRGYKNLSHPITPRSSIFTFYFLLFTFFLAGFLSALISPNYRAAAGLFKAYFFDGFLIFLMVASCRKKNLLINGLVLSGFWVSLHAIWQKITGQLTPDGRVLGIFNENPNYLALFLAPIGTIVFGKVLMRASSFKALASGLVLISIFSALFFSASRGGLIAFAAGGIFILIYSKILNLKSIFSKIALIIFIILAIFAAAYFFRPIPHDLGRVGQSSNIRWEIWKVSIQMVKENPIKGVGLANFQKAFTKRMDGVPNFNEYISPLARYPHNLYLALWLETGLLGLLSFLGIIVLVFIKEYGFKNLDFRMNKKILNLKSKILPIKRSYTRIVLLGAVFTILVYGLVDTPFFKNDLAVLFFLFVGLMI